MPSGNLTGAIGDGYAIKGIIGLDVDGMRCFSCLTPKFVYMCCFSPKLVFFPKLYPERLHHGLPKNSL